MFMFVYVHNNNISIIRRSAISYLKFPFAMTNNTFILKIKKLIHNHTYNILYQYKLLINNQLILKKIKKLQVMPAHRAGFEI